MLRRMILLSAATLFAWTALCDAFAPNGRWHTTAIPWNRSLPTVEVTLGYPGHYIPTGNSPNSPIELKASAATSPFDGYIGYRFAVGRKKTNDIPVLSRARIDGGGTWVFTTTAQPNWERWNRELVVQWYDHAMHLIAQRNVGRPPWSDERPLRIVRDPAATVLPQYLGKPPVVIAQQDLGGSTQWYLGFSNIIAPLDLWLDLPLPTRQKIFASGTKTIVFGFPRADQHFTEIDRALIPVEFSSSPAEMQIPALYRTRATKQLFPVSWRATEGSRPAGGEVSPYLVIGTLGVYSADETALSRRLPAAEIDFVGEHWRELPKTVIHDRLHVYWREFRPAYVFMIALLACFAIWQFMIRGHAVMAAAFALIVAITAITARASIRRTSGESVVESKASITPNVIRHTIYQRSFGPSPLPAAAVPGEVAEWWLGQIEENVREHAEIRSSTTAPGHGAVVIASAWDTTSRVRWRQEILPAPALRVKSADDTTIAIDLDRRVSARYIAVHWFWKKHLRWGVRPLVSGQEQVTVKQNDRLPELTDFRNWGYWPRGFGIARITLVEERRNHKVGISLTVPSERLKSSSLIPFELSQSLSRDSDRTFSGTFLLPADEMSAGTEIVASLTLPLNVALKGMKLTGSSGTIDLMAAPARRVRSLVTYYVYATDISQLQRIAGPRDVVRVDVETTAPVERIWVQLTVRKKSS